MFDQYFLTVVIGNNKPYDVSLESFQTGSISFGRDNANHIVINSGIASSFHGSFIMDRDQLFVIDNNSRNGIYVNGAQVFGRVALSPGDTIRFDTSSVHQNYSVTMLLNKNQISAEQWTAHKIQGGSLTIGRDEQSGLVINKVSVSRNHATVIFENGQYFIIDNNSTNGVFVNGIRISGRMRLLEKDVIMIANTKLIFSGDSILSLEEQPRFSIEVSGVYKTVQTKEGALNILNDINFFLNPNEFVAVVGASGAGKSTLLNCMCGFSQATEGQILINNDDLYENYEIYKNLIGYVPQQDIVHTDLTLYSMLKYTAEMRMPKDTTKQEREKRIDEVIKIVELTGKEETLIKKLSGGQKKRASIAVELMSDPNVFFLDEATSGLDPGTEQNLMVTLKNMTYKNKTVILITHATLNIGLCDKVVVMGTGGRLCFCGTPTEALAFFKTDNFVDIYKKINDDPQKWQAKFKMASAANNPERQYSEKAAHNPKKGINKNSSFMQLWTLIRRYIALIIADKKRLALLLLQAPILGLLLALVSYKTEASGVVTVFKYSSEASSLLFALSCAAFWIGMLNSVQEICKERDIFKRERMAKLKLLPYIGSKLIVLGVLCLVQSFMLLIVVRLILGIPTAEGLGVNPFAGMFISTYLTALSATGLGLAVSTISPNPDRAMTLAPIILMPQILFSGVAFELKDFANHLSNLINCKWSVQAYSILANVNALWQNADTENTIPNTAYTFLKSNLHNVWIALLVITLVCLLFSVLMLSMEPADS